LRIGIVTATYRPSRNGVATSTSMYVQGLRALGHEVRVFAPTHPEATSDDGVYRMPSTGLGAPADYPLLLPYYRLISGPLPIADLEIIHTMHPFVAGRIALAWARQLRIPLVFTANTQYHRYLHYTPLPNRLAQWLVARHVRTFAERADVVLAPGQAMYETLRNYGYRGQIQNLPNPVDLSRFQGLDANWVREQFSIPADAPLLVYVGRLTPEKNLEVLLQAFRLVLGKLPAAHLLLVGDGAVRPVLEQHAAGLPVHFAGAVPYAQVGYFLTAADLFVTASTSEVLPMTVLEALATGTPVVAAQSAAARELIEQDVNGMVCAPEARAISEGIMRAFSPGHIQALQQGARERALVYSLDSLAQSLIGIYEKAQHAEVGAAWA
jgi:1,2-diacylglycerol 3-alpha-glucosyltransferase